MPSAIFSATTTSTCASCACVRALLASARFAHSFRAQSSVPSAVFGIDLNAASNIVFLEPCQNEQIEVSAVARAARAGQQRRVKVTTLLVQGSMEEDMIQRRAHLNMTSLELLLAAMPVPDSLVQPYREARHFGRDLVRSSVLVSLFAD